MKNDLNQKIYSIEVDRKASLKCKLEIEKSFNELSESDKKIGYNPAQIIRDKLIEYINNEMPLLQNTVSPPISSRFS